MDLSRVEAILKAGIDGTLADFVPVSRVEELLIQLIQAGGGSGGSVNPEQVKRIIEEYLREHPVDVVDEETLRRLINEQFPDFDDVVDIIDGVVTVDENDQNEKTEKWPNWEEYQELEKQVTQLKGDKLDKPEDAPAVGKVLRVKQVNNDGTFVCEWADAPSGGVADIVNSSGESLLDDTKVMQVYAHGIQVVTAVTGGRKVLACSTPSAYYIEARHANAYTKYLPVTLQVMDNCVKAAMCDGKGAAWTAKEQQAAQKRLGIVTLTQEEYDLLETKGESTIYVIVG